MKNISTETFMKCPSCACNYRTTGLTLGNDCKIFRCPACDYNYKNNKKIWKAIRTYNKEVQARKTLQKDLEKYATDKQERSEQGIMSRNANTDEPQ